MLWRPLLFAVVALQRPEEKSRVRTIVTAEHTREELDICLDAFDRVGRELAVI